MKDFNTTAICIPEKHYMVDTTNKIEQIEELIQKGKYFTINRARQYGKTTTFSTLNRRLKERYFVVRFSFEGVGDIFFESDYLFVRNFINRMSGALRKGNVPQASIEEWKNISDLSKESDAFSYLSDKITTLCDGVDKEVILMIDEVDKSSDNQIFLHFLGALRDKYLDYADGGDTTFKSVILAGVYDIKNMKLKLRPDEEKKYNSPWNTREGNEPNESLLSFGDCPWDYREFTPYNIAVDFNVDMSFSSAEISTMLQEYEADYHTGMDIAEMSNEIYKYTSGYPYLVSAICKWIDEQGDKIWNVESVVNATKYIINNKSTLIDSMIKNYENNPKLQRVIDRMILEGYSFPFTITDEVVDLGVTFGIFPRKEGALQISNKIFEIILYNHIIMKKLRTEDINIPIQSQFIQDGRLNMKQVLLKFQELMKAEYRKEDEQFLEAQGRLLFLCFLKPIINGIGFYYVEPETRNNERMDVVVTYGGEEHIVELKLWHGEEYRKKGIVQLENYMDSRSAKRGYLLSFSFLKEKEYISQTIDLEDVDKSIFEVVV